MPSEIEKLLDEIGWADMPQEGRKFCWAVFRWAQQTTIEIDRLTEKVENLERVLALRTDHLV